MLGPQKITTSSYEIQPHVTENYVQEVGELSNLCSNQFFVATLINIVFYPMVVPTAKLAVTVAVVNTITIATCDVANLIADNWLRDLGYIYELINLYAPSTPSWEFLALSPYLPRRHRQPAM